MTTYETLVFLHVVAAVAWVGGSLLMTVLLGQALRTREEGDVASLARQAGVFGPFVAAPAMLALIAFGLWAALDLDLDLGATWITIGFVGWGIGLVLGGAYHGPRNAKLRRAVDEEGGRGPRVTRLLQERLLVSGLEVALYVFVIWAMVAKPG